MPRNLRVILPEVPYHVTQRGVDRMDVFDCERDRLVYLGLAADLAQEAGVHITAYCLMRNHVHWIVTPERADSLAIFFRRGHGRYAQYFNAAKRRIGHLWQNRYFACALGDTHMVRAIRYVEWNPIRAGLAGQAGDYRWSSARAHLQGPGHEEIPLLDWTYCQQAGGAAGWKEIVDEPEDARQSHVLRSSTYAGRPWGTPEFLAAMEERCGRHWRKPGRPAKVLSA